MGVGAQAPYPDPRRGVLEALYCVGDQEDSLRSVPTGLDASLVHLGLGPYLSATGSSSDYNGESREIVRMDLFEMIVCDSMPPEGMITLARVGRRSSTTCALKYHIWEHISCRNVFGHGGG